MEFPMFGEDVIDGDRNPVITWDLINHKRIEHLPDGSAVTRDFTPEEIDKAGKLLTERGYEVEADNLLSKARGAVIANRAWLNRSTAPTNAQAIDQIDRLTRQMNAIIFLRLGDYRDTSGT